MSKLKLLLYLLFSLSYTYGQYKCELEIDSGKLDLLSIDSLYSFSSLEFKSIVKKFKEKNTSDSFQILYYRNTGIESLNYLYLDKDSLNICNNKGFILKSISQSEFKRNIKKELDEIFTNKLTLFTQTCPKDYGPIGGKIIEFIVIKRNNSLFLVYYGDKDSVHAMKPSSISLKLKVLIDEIYFKWIGF